MVAKNQIKIKQIDGEVLLNTIFDDVLFTNDFVIIDFEKFAQNQMGNGRNYEQEISILCNEIFMKLQNEFKEYMDNNV